LYIEMIEKVYAESSDARHLLKLCFYACSVSVFFKQIELTGMNNRLFCVRFLSNSIQEIINSKSRSFVRYRCKAGIAVEYHSDITGIDYGNS